VGVRYDQFPPSPQLATMVERFWLLEGDAAEIAAEPIPPDGRTEIIVHAAAPFAEVQPGGRRRPQDRALFAGQITKAVTVVPTGFSRLAGARLSPHGAYALFGVAQDTFTDRIVPMADIDADLAAALHELVATADADALVPGLDRAIAARPPAHALEEVVVAPAVAVAFARRGLVPVSDLAAATGLGARQFERRFQREVGLTPKRFLRILRFQEVLSALRFGSDDAPRWADVAASHGFYDQAHFIRDFKSFVGTSPAAWNVTDSSLAAIFSAIRRKRL
jgi:AraC-like DNA-binding protein